MNKKLLATAIAGAMIAPSAFAAQDTSGMQYTSAAEGFYASIRARFNSGGTDNAGAEIQNSTSRFGVRGTNDLGGGLSGFYQYEAGVSIDNGGGLSTRLGHVGLRGAFGEVVAGSIWTNGYNMTYGSTDIANVASGNVVYTTLFPGRESNVVQYTTPDFNGFQASALVQMDNKGTATVEDGSDIDHYMLTAKYGTQGFTAGVAYSVVADALTTSAGTDDHTGYALKLGYAQDNWYVNTWYAEDNRDNENSDTPLEDTETFSIAGGISVSKVNLYALYETQDNVDGNNGVEDNYGTFGVQYNLGARSRVWVEYANRDLESDAEKDDYVTIGLRHDF